MYQPANSSLYYKYKTGKLMDNVVFYFLCYLNPCLEYQWYEYIIHKYNEQLLLENM